MISRTTIKIFVCIILCFASLPAIAQDNSDRVVDIKIYFPYDQAHIDPEYMGNHASLHIADSLLNDRAFISTVGKIEIVAQSSPEGRVSYNERLSERRRRSLERYLTAKYPHIELSMWSFESIAENWELFREHLEEDTNLPSRNEILAIVDGHRHADTKEWLLKTLNGGTPWLYIKEHILPTQRFGASVLFIPLKEIQPEPVIEPAQVEPKVAVEPKPEPKPEPVKVIEQVEPKIKSSKMIFAVKTNLLLDAVSVINLAVEVPIGKRWSVVGEVVHPWWRSWPNDFTMQIESYHAELKYWLGDRDTKEQLQGWYFGAYGGWGRYDIQPFSRTGVQGSFTDLGLEIGYAHAIARNLHLEYTFGMGYVATKYNDYYMVNNTEEYGDIKVIPYPWMNNSLKTTLPTRLGVSLVWTIKSKGGRK